MSFPVLFSSQFAAIMEALLKAAVLEVTALVEDGAAELRLELRDKDREIRDKDRKIQELRAAVELLKAREEAAVGPGSSGVVEKQTQSCVWTKEQEDNPDVRSAVKSEPTEEFTSTSSTIEPQLESMDNEMYSQGYQSYNAQFNTANEETDDSSHWFEQETLASDTAHLQNIGEDLHLNDLQQAGLSLLPPKDNVCSNNNERTRRFNTKRLNHIESGFKAGFICDQCGKCFTEKRRLNSHQSVHTGAKPFICGKCGQRFSRSDSLARHERIGRLCGKEVASKLMFKQKDTPQSSVESPDMRPTMKSDQTEEFTATSSTIEPQSDSIDNEMYSQGYQSHDAQLNTTNEETDDSSLWFEPLASDTAPSQNIGEDLHLNDLQQAGLSLLPPKDNVRSKNKRTRCFNTKRLNHIESGSNTGFRCDQCGKCFTEKRRLMTHESVHTGAKPFSCSKCGQRFSRRDSLARHEQSGRGCRC